MKPQPKLTQYIDSIVNENRDLKKKNADLEQQLAKANKENIWMRKYVPAHLLSIEGKAIVPMEKK